MKKEKRVKTKEDFQKVISNNQKKVSNSFVIYYLKKESNESARYGISSSKKLGNAVTRVKVRRQIRAMINEIEKEEIISNNDYVIIVRKKFLDNDYRSNMNELRKILKRIGGTINE